MPAATQWQITKADDGWTLLRQGQPFYINGAVAPNRFDLLHAAGGNAVRTNPSDERLDAAQAAGLAVMANLRVHGERHGFDWNDPAQVEEQKQKVLAVVREFKDHPAIMFWSVGNELDHVPGRGEHTYDRRLWTGLNDLAIAIKEIDTNHPVMTTVGAGHFEAKVQEMAESLPDMDLLGINSYGDLKDVTELTRRYWPKPYVVAEWGPTGHWQVRKTRWGAPVEQTSREKARSFAQRYRTVIAEDRTHCLGSFAFYWSAKQETTHTWYGLFLDGLRTESIDVLQKVWTGVWPENRAPAVHNLRINEIGDEGDAVLEPGTNYHATVAAADPDGDALEYQWDIRPEVVIPRESYAGSMEQPAQPIPGLIQEPATAEICFTTPAEPGAYRLFVTVTDGHGHIAYGNIPFLLARMEP
jgi:hypothetical protein